MLKAVTPDSVDPFTAIHRFAPILLESKHTKSSQVTHRRYMEIIGIVIVRGECQASYVEASLF